MNCTLYHTKEGHPVYCSRLRLAIWSCRRAVKKAKAMGYTSLVATEPDGNRVDYCNFFQANQGAT